MKKGSALLVVLGMLSFMVVSAVAFSIYMRQNRLPSSFLRQNILSRQLVKAGLAQAMSELDLAIGDAKYPGHEFGNESNKNYWRNRVYMGVSGDGYQDNEENEHLKNTVSTFPLEGLAYIPPPLVNTVRYWARRSPSATWKNLDYDSGRYAFTAVNVSDYLDINRLRANVMRDSSPSNRLSLAFLFENDNHSGWGSCSPSKFDAAMDTLNGSPYGRLVSMADYNLALSADANGPLAQSGFTSPFCEFIKSPPSGAEFYVNEEQARIQKFVTDSWYPGGEITDLVLSDYERPTLGASFSSPNGIQLLEPGLMSLMKDGVSPIFNKIKQHLNLAERAALRDYVDVDNVPSSLALPTLERTPMLTGLVIKPMNNFQPQVEKLPDQPPVTPWNGNPRKQASISFWKLNGFGNPSVVVQGTAVYPFKRSSGLSEEDQYPIQVLVKAYLVEDGRTFTDVRAPDSFAYRPTSKDEWKADNLLGASDRGYISLFGTGFVSVSKNRKTENDVLIQVNGASPITLTAANTETFEKPLFGWRSVVEDTDGDGTFDTPSAADSGYDISRFSEAGGVNNKFYYLDSQGQLQPVDGASGTLKLKWQYFAWVRIIGDDDKTVDMFPATLKDDVVYNDINGDVQTIATQLGIDASRDPLLPVAGPPAFDFTTGAGFIGAAVGSEQPGETVCCYCSDPRFNWAPEDWWFVENGTGVQATEWFMKTQTYRDGTDYRQHDIFQFVSNQGYLQSMGELQFLPLVRRDYNDFTEGNAIQGGIFRNGGQYDGVRRKDVGNAANQDYMWRTRCAFGEYADWDKGGETQDSYNWGIVDRRGGAAVNPFADEDLFMAALANTPYDYIVAAEVENKEDKKMEDNIDLCFNARSSEARIDWETLREIARKMREKFIASGQSSAPGGNGQNTETANDSFGWEEWDEWEKGKSGDFFETLGNEIHDVDRKFLFSYWKPCFANSQQLFLLFVRAEPTVIGGSSAGHTPSQLGARAVALVWREPVSTVAGSQGQGGNQTSTGSVHRMRILFYHQFE